MTKLDLPDLAERAFWTFIMAAVPLLSLEDLSTARTALIAGGAGVLSLLKNVAKQRLEARRGD